MSKVICDICGTTYQDTADCCPICGCSREAAAELIGGELLMEESVEPRTKGGRFSSNTGKKREIFDFDEVNTAAEPEEEEPEYPYDGEEYEDEPRHNTFLVVFLTILIILLLVATGVIFIKFFLPNMLGSEETVPTTETQMVETTQAPTQTTELRIPCQGLALSSANAELTHEGNYFLLNVIITPADTTDELVFTSADESIATVTADGRITAVSEGETVVFITCGDQQLACPVTCKFVEETEATEATVDATEAAGETVPETTKSNVELKLKQTDFRLGVYYQWTIQLDCDLEQNEVEWSSEHPYIATVDENGMVTAIKAGTTVITAKYGDQEAQCIVRCYVP